MKITLLPAALLLLVTISAFPHSGPQPPPADAPSPPGLIWSPPAAALAERLEPSLRPVREYSDSLGSTAVMIIHRGVLIAEWGDTSRKINLHSIRKSLLSALIGIAVEEKQMNLESTLEELGIDDNAPALTPGEKRATALDLLKARSGVFHPALYESASMKEKRPKRGSHPPGSFWYYNNWDFNALGRIYENAVGRSIFEAFDEIIAKPLQMQDYTPADGRYVTGEDSRFPAYPIRMSARDLARFALLYLREGVWGERRILPRQWVLDSVKPYSATGDGGYGYMWWINEEPYGTPGPFAHGSYYASGVGGQAAFIHPGLDLILIHRVDTAETDRRVSRKEVGRLFDLIVATLPQIDQALTSTKALRP